MPGDDRHEVRSAEFLRGAFVEAVVAPVGLHVAAKRYLCAIDPTYHAGLSAASVRSLAHQGGPLTPAECEQFRRQAYWDAAVRVRRWDDLAKVPGRITPPVATYRGPLGRVRPAPGHQSAHPEEPGHRGDACGSPLTAPCIIVLYNPPRRDPRTRHLERPASAEHARRGPHAGSPVRGPFPR